MHLPSSAPETQSQQSRLYFLDVGISTPALHGRILTCHPDGSGFRELITNIRSLPDGIAIDKEAGHIYWTNMGIPSANDGSIQRCNLDGKDIVTIVPKGYTHTPKQLTIARHSRKLYWSDREGMRVMRADMDGGDVEVLYVVGDVQGKRVEDWCVGIAVDEEAGQVFWTQKGPSKGNGGRIFKMGIELREGETAESRSDVKIVKEGLPEPIDLELDHEQRKLYWTDRGDPPYGNSVNVVGIDEVVDTKARPEILVRKLHEGIGIALDLQNQRMFFGDLGGSLYSSNLDGSCKTTIIPDIGGAVTGIAYVE